MGELYEGCLREELRTTEGDAVEAADIGSVEEWVFGRLMWARLVALRLGPPEELSLR